MCLGKLAFPLLSKAPEVGGAAPLTLFPIAGDHSFTCWWSRSDHSQRSDQRCRSTSEKKGGALPLTPACDVERPYSPLSSEAVKRTVLYVREQAEMGNLRSRIESKCEERNHEDNYNPMPPPNEQN